MKHAHKAILAGWFVFVLFVLFGIYCEVTRAEPQPGQVCDMYGRNCERIISRDRS